jgi:toxin-antitoxin system PIN domain toxin
VLLDVNVLVALAWDSHVHHQATRAWFADQGQDGWATCTLTEAGFVRVSSNPRALPAPISATAARDVLAALRRAGAHRFLETDVSLLDADVPVMATHGEVTDTVLLVLARRHGTRLVTFDQGLARRGGETVALLRA